MLLTTWASSVDTVKRVLEHMALQIQNNNNNYNHENGEVWYDDYNGEWTTMAWLPEHELDYQDRIIVKCQRSPTGRFKRHTDIEFRVMEFNHEVGKLGAKTLRIIPMLMIMNCIVLSRFILRNSTYAMS